MTTRDGSLVYVRVESDRDRAREDIADLPIISNSFEMATVFKGLMSIFFQD